MKRIAAALALALLIPACMHKSQDQLRRTDLDGKKLILMKGYEKVVHSSPDCAALKSARGTPVNCKVKDGRLIDENGQFKNGPETRFALCSCVQ